MIGAIFPSLDSALFGGALEALQSEIASSGYTLVVASSNYDPEREHHHVRNLLASGIDALMLVGGVRDDAIYRLIDRKNLPYVLIWVSQAEGGHPCIGFDNQAAAGALTRHLLDMGHRRIAVISGYLVGNDRATARMAGIEAALADRDLTLREDYVVETRDGRPFAG
jgi:LacI family transcriptional regulator